MIAAERSRRGRRARGHAGATVWACVLTAACAGPSATDTTSGGGEGGQGGSLSTSSTEQASGGQGGGGEGGQPTTPAEPKITDVRVYAADPTWPLDNVLCVVRRDEPACCWGSGLFGQLGNGADTASYWASPVSVLGTGAAQVHPGMHFTCGFTSGGKVYCWGGSYSGELGLGDPGPGAPDVLVPQELAGIEGAAGLTVGRGSCAWTAAGELYCWGSNSSGQLGLGAVSDEVLVPVLVSGLPGIASAATRDGATCALAEDGSVWCWGAFATPTPTKLPAAGTDNAEIHVSGSHRCVLKTGGEVMCWGGSFSLTPALVEHPFGPARGLGVGHHFTCLLLENGDVRCWGKNGLGQLGDGTLTDHSQSADAVLVLGDAVRIVSAHHTSCAWKKDGSVWCWGYLPMNVEESFIFTPPVLLPDDFACDGATVPPLSYEDAKEVDCDPACP